MLHKHEDLSLVTTPTVNCTCWYILERRSGGRSLGLLASQPSLLGELLVSVGTSYKMEWRVIKDTSNTSLCSPHTGACTPAHIEIKE